MTWHAYLSFVSVAVIVVLVPGPDFAVVTTNTLAGGRRRGWATSLGIACSNALQGAAAVAGLGALIVASQPVFDTIRWAGVCYLFWLALQALRSAWRGTPNDRADGPDAEGATREARRGFRQGFLSNVTNPKVLVFYLAVVPQFLGAGAPWWALLLLALTHAVVGLLYLGLLIGVLHQARRVLARDVVRRTLDAVTGFALGAFGVRLAWESR